MNQTFTSAAEALRVARHLSFLLRRDVYRFQSVNSHGVTVWVVSLQQTPHNAPQEL